MNPAVEERRARLIVAALSALASLAALLYAVSAPLQLAKLNDFYRESWPAYSALSHGHVVEFLTLAPGYVGSLILRAPFALIATAASNDPRVTYFATALPCLIPVVGFVVWLAAQPRRRGGIGWASRLVPIVCCIFNPVVLVALFGGHPEEVLGATLCVGSVILAGKGRAGWAGLVVGLAVVNKPWAVVAVPVVVAALPQGRRRALASTAATAGAVFIPVVLALHGHALNASLGAAKVGTIFNPPELLWWFGSRSWLAQNSHVLIVFVALGATALWSFIRRAPGSGSQDLPAALLLLALVLLLRAALDPWNNVYYHVPFLFALVAYEARSGRMPVLTGFYTLLLNVVAPVSGVPHMSGDMRAAAYAAMVLPTLAYLAAETYLSPRRGWTGRIVRRLPRLEGEPAPAGNHVAG